jgi:hypothetical protein
LCRRTLAKTFSISFSFVIDDGGRWDKTREEGEKGEKKGRNAKEGQKVATSNSTRQTWRNVVVANISFLSFFLPSLLSFFLAQIKVFSFFFSFSFFFLFADTFANENIICWTLK